MNVLDHILRGGDPRASYPPDHDYWYQPVGTLTTSGAGIDEETAQKVSAWYRGKDILSTSLAMLPLMIYRRLPEDAGRERARGLPVDTLVHRKPNAWQDSFQWRRLMMRWLIDHGNAYNRIVATERAVTGYLQPIAPRRVRVVDQDVTGRLIYRVRDRRGVETSYTQDEIFHLRGASEDGMTGVGILRWASGSVGLALSTESYASSIFAQGALHGGILRHPGTLTKEASERMALSFQRATSGERKWHAPAVLEQGVEWVESTMTAEEAQMLLSRKFSVTDIARWLGLPPHMLGDLDRSTNNNIEHQGQEFVTYSLGGWLALFESAIQDQLLVDPETYYAEFTRDALVRGDIATRWQAYLNAVNTGTFTRNEVRVLENKNTLPGLDEPLTPANITGKQEAPPMDRGRDMPRQDPPEEDDARERRRRRERSIAVEAAARILRKEIVAVEKAAVRHAADGDAFGAWVTEFYLAHARLVREALQLSEPAAEHYCWSQAQQIVNGAGWVQAVALWKTTAYAEGLAALAIDDDEEAA